ncbi:hypothetical protein [Falsibacillus albus]|uniref:Uncharacterized protein n=1 Tax=Falsibacillus albus TaxID=2478915 RepID=A0A3L7JVV2_9BACI|nr:hypothetical protein [Falsibacillus albus]RLQ93791.1 hypothetical protein D9X91_16090 [Falsibacillus albus]
MPKSSDNNNTQVTPHRDGDYDRVISDSNSTLGKEAGVVSEDHEHDNPYHLSELGHDDKQMEKFKRIMKGRKVEDKD